MVDKLPTAAFLCLCGEGISILSSNKEGEDP